MGAAIAATPWKQLLLSALESNSRLRHSTFFQLATVGSDGRPSNRTVVFRGFEENTCKIHINTDCRTRKIEELKHCPFVEFRINGTVDVVDEELPDPVMLQIREKSWFASSIKSRLQYLGPTPGIPCLIEQLSQEVFLDPTSGPVASFCLLVVDPEKVDYLNLKSNQRMTFTLRHGANGENCWNSESINP